MAIYRKIDGLRYHMEQIWESGEINQFPSTNINYVENYKYIEDFMNQNCHGNINVGAAANGSGLLTDHGPDHVRMVIECAGKLIGDMSERALNGYEIYLLMLAAHFHDVGNALGREDHEKKIDEIIYSLGTNFPLDTPERLIVSNIATSHGGHAPDPSHGKDTLFFVDTFQSCNGISIRPALLASILRFADELSDDNTRSNRFLTLINATPPENRIYHAYSASLSPISFRGNVIEFKYYIPYEQTQTRIPDENGVFLYDEIMKRLTKCMNELEYCRKYSEGFIRITTISVEINVMDSKVSHRPKKRIQFSLRLSGYPQSFSGLIDSLEYENGEALMKAVSEQA